MDEYITKMIKAGYAPEEIFEKAKTEFEKQRAAEEKLKKQKQVEKARKEMIAATANYVELLDPSIKISKEDIQEIDKTIAELEKAETASKINKTTYDDPIFTFLKKIGAI
jgi:hypothetical protein